jgi:two-component system chemotaxis response regulator CheY
MCKIMIVDDEPMIVELYSEMVAQGGHEVVATAENGTQAVSTFEGMLPPPDLILMDHRMPHKNGLDATREIVAGHPGTKVLLVTADEHVLYNAVAGGACGFLEKPFSMDKLNGAIALVLEGGSPQGYREAA